MATSTSTRGETESLRDQLGETCDESLFPLDGPSDLLTLMARGRDVFVIEEGELLALELVLTVGDSLCFPYESVDSLVDDISTALHNTR